MEELIKDMDLKEKMELYNKGLISLPNEYINTHLEKAENELAELVEFGFEIENKEVKSDGWGDGFKCLHATLVDKRTNEKTDIKWHDRNKEFFHKSETGGSFPLRFKDGFEFLK